MDETVIWSIIDKYFKNNPNVLVEHHLESFNDFFRNFIMVKLLFIPFCLTGMVYENVYEK